MAFPKYKIDYSENLPFETKPIELKNPFVKSPHLHRHDFYELMFFEAGSGFHTIDFKKYPVEQGAVFFLSPGQVHMLELDSEPVGTYVTFDEEFLLAFSHDTGLLSGLSFFHSYTALPKLTLDKSSKVKESLDALTAIFSNNSIAGRPHLLRSHLTILLFELESIYRTNYETQLETFSSDLVSRFKRLIDLEFNGSRLVKDYAKKLAVSPGHLNSVVKNETGTTAGAWLRKRAILEAKRLLVEKDKTIAQIAYELSFDEPSNFIKFFKKETNSTPGEFRLSGDR